MVDLPNSQSANPGDPVNSQVTRDESLSANHVRMILDTAMDGIISMDHNQKMILFNRAAEEIFGWKAGEVLGRPIDLLIPGRFLSGHRMWVEQFGQG